MTQKGLINRALTSRPCGRADPLPSPLDVQHRSANPKPPPFKPAGHCHHPSASPARTMAARPPRPARGREEGEERKGAPAALTWRGAPRGTCGCGCPWAWRRGAERRRGKREESRSGAEGTGGSAQRHGLTRHPPAASEGHRALRHFRSAARGAGLVWRPRPLRPPEAPRSK